MPTFRLNFLPRTILKVVVSYNYLYHPVTALRARQSSDLEILISRE
jgi:hypothetical protein